MQPIEHLSIDWMGLSFGDIIPDVFLAGLIISLIILSLFKTLNRVVPYLAAIGVAATIGLNQFLHPGIGIGVIILVAGLISILLQHKEPRVEYFIFIITIIIGSNLLMVFDNLVMILLSIELISISSYVLVAGSLPDKLRAEAAWKFFIYGSIATAIMIFGMTYLYGTTGSLELSKLEPSNLMSIIGGAMFLTGFLFKMTAAPFHLWAPDVYEATPAPVVAFLSVAPKLAAFIAILNLVEWPFLIAALATLTIVVGTLAALSQTDAKRMMAYSSVAQAGFFLAVIASHADRGVVLFYAAVFAIMNYTVFLVIHQVEKNGSTKFTAFNGIGYTNPFAAIALTLGLISLVGIPPVAGFMAKLFVFTALWASISSVSSPVFMVLFVTGLLATVASLFFYLKIPFYMFFRRSDEKQPIKISPFINLLLVILVGLLLTLFIAPGLLAGLGY